MSESYDLIAIGAGPAGESATELAALLRRRCALIEKAWLGGTVSATGSAPTKTLREALLCLASFRDVYGRQLSAHLRSRRVEVPAAVSPTDHAAA